MKNKTIKFHRLSRRIVAQFCIFTLVLSTIYASLGFTLLYHLEDNFIEREVAQEARYLSNTYKKSSVWPKMRSPHMSLHFSKDDLPVDMKQKFFDEPNSKEFYGKDGRHYHLLTIPEYKNIYLVAEVSQKLLVRPIREGVVKIFAFFGTVLTLIAFFIAYMIGRQTAKPLQKLSDLVDGVELENIPSTFAHQFPNNEIGILARTLESSMQQISKTLEREKCFTRDASHELRTPVAIIKNAVEVYREKNNLDGQNSDLIDRISDASMQMEQTVNTLLILAREEHTSASKNPVNILPLIEQTILDHGYLLHEKPVEVQVTDNCHTQVFAQQGMLKVLLDNLISNAFQYTDMGEVSIDFSNDTLIIKDTGKGIEKDISEQVTEPTVKGSQSTGYGFGLSIVKRLCEHQGWQLKVASNEGTTVSVTFVDNLTT